MLLRFIAAATIQALRQAITRVLSPVIPPAWSCMAGRGRLAWKEWVVEGWVKVGDSLQVVDLVGSTER